MQTLAYSLDSGTVTCADDRNLMVVPVSYTHLAEVQRRVEAVTSSVHSSPEMSTVLSRRRI